VLDGGGWFNAVLHPGMTGYPPYRRMHGNIEENNNNFRMVGLLAEF
jgi:hypothetical protein